MTDPDNRNTKASHHPGGDALFQAIGGLEGITRLVERFYQLMDSEAHAAVIRQMHGADLTESHEKLVAFLSGWLGGPALYRERYGAINLPMAHRHLDIDKAGAQSWLDCMAQALADQGCPEELRQHLLSRFAIPAEGIRLMSEHRVKTPVDPGLFHEVK